MWGLIDDNCLSEAKRLGHPEVTKGHIAYCLARALEKKGAEGVPASSNEIAAFLPPPSSAAVQPVFPDDCQDLISRIEDENSAREVLQEILSNDEWKTSPGQLGDESLEDLLAELDRLIGLGSVKAEVRELVALQQVAQVRAAEGLPPVEVGLHLVFTGDPGTGKTTVARLISRIYRCLGLLSKGHLVEVGRADLVAGYVGQTAQTVQAAFDAAQGGVLFIDEAYALTPMDPRDYGAEALATLVLEMENRREDIAVIAAGYEEPMRHFIDANEGLQSRFQTMIAFQGYTHDELVQIWQLFADRAQIAATPEVLAAVRRHFDGVATGGPTGNARYARRLFEEMYRELAIRAAADNQVDVSEITAFVVEDVPDPEGAEDSSMGLYL